MIMLIGLILILMPLALYFHQIHVRKKYWKDYIARRTAQAIDRDQ